MKVLYLTPGIYDKGGISRYNRFQIQALRDLLGAENVAVISLLGPESSARDLETPFTVDHSSSGRKIDFIRASLRFTSKNKPNVVWSGLMNFSVLTLGLARVIDAKAVVQVYGREVWSPRRSRPDIPWAFQHVDMVVADSHYTAKFVEQHFHPDKEVPVVWDCVDTERFYPSKPAVSVLARYTIPSPDKHFNILTLGRLSKYAAYKGYERLLEVFPRLPEHARLVYGGGGDLIPRLKARAEDLGLADRVVFTGFVHELDLPDVYRSASVFCLVGDSGPGRGEGIPLTPLEAAACGVPILVGDQDGSREAVEQAVNGYSLDPFDLDTIADHLILLASNEELLKQMGRAAHRRIKQEHAYPVFRERMRALIPYLAQEEVVTQ